MPVRAGKGARQQLRVELSAHQRLTWRAVAVSPSTMAHQSWQYRRRRSPGRLTYTPWSSSINWGRGWLPSSRRSNSGGGSGRGRTRMFPGDGGGGQRQTSQSREIASGTLIRRAVSDAGGVETHQGVGRHG